MALKTLVKISSVNNLSDARYGAGMGVGLMGFNLDTSNDHYINIDVFTEITNWISGVKIVGEFGASDAQYIKDTLTNYPLDFVQVSDVNKVLEIKSANFPIILKINPASYTDLVELKELLESVKEHITYFLFESEDSKDINIDYLLKLSAHYPMLLDAGVTMENLDYLTTQSNIKGIAIKGGNEIQPGIRDFDEMADMLEFLEID